LAHTPKMESVSNLCHLDFL